MPSTLKKVRQNPTATEPRPLLTGAVEGGEVLTDLGWPCAPCSATPTITERLADLPAHSPLRLENAVVDLVGEEMWARTQTETMGFHWNQYLASLADLVRDKIRIAARTGGQTDDLWRLLHGLAAMTPPSSGEMLLRRDLDLAVREAVKDTTTTLAEAGIAPGWPSEILRPTPAGDPLLLADEYGSRYALLAPFAWGEEDPHWYCWDIDRCTRDQVVHAPSSREQPVGRVRQHGPAPHRIVPDGMRATLEALARAGGGRTGAPRAIQALPHVRLPWHAEPRRHCPHRVRVTRRGSKHGRCGAFETATAQSAVS